MSTKLSILFSLVTCRSMNRFSPVTCCNCLMIGSERSLMFYRETNIHPVCECSRGLSMLGTISALWQKNKQTPITVENWKHIQKMEELLKNETVKKKIKTLSVEIRVSQNGCSKFWNRFFYNLTGGKNVSFHAILSMAESIKYKFNGSKT